MENLWRTCGEPVENLSLSAHPLQQPGRVLADVSEARDDVVQVEVAERGVVLTLSPHLETETSRVRNVSGSRGERVGSRN